MDFADPVNLIPLAAGIIAGVGGLTIAITSTFSITGIATGYHGTRAFRRRPADVPGAAGMPESAESAG
ncbi:MAG: hypothetical protein ACLP7J_24860 [Streptosporangiaceae bacterium]